MRSTLFLKMEDKKIMRSIKKLHKAISAPIANLSTYRALPSSQLDQIDPFLFLNHHGHQVYAPNNTGLPFGPHPHRGFETLTFILSGDIMHTDSGGGSSIIKAGGIQWMTAGSGLIHAEVSSDEFKKKGGEVEILQLWINLPARLKMTQPRYVGLQKDQIPMLQKDEEKVTIHAISGDWGDIKGPVETFTDINMSTIEFLKGGAYSTSVKASRNIFLYIVKGQVKVNSETAAFRTLVEFNNDGEYINITALEDSIILFGHAEPLNEPVVAHGPFVMNSEEEIRQAMKDYQMGKMGTWAD